MSVRLVVLADVPEMLERPAVGEIIGRAEADALAWGKKEGTRMDVRDLRFLVIVFGSEEQSETGEEREVRGRR